MSTPKEHIVFFNIGSNLGNRRLNLSRAVSALEKEFGYFELSHTVESKPMDFESANPFLNVSMMVRTQDTPEEILDKVLAIERSISQVPHRNPDGSYRDREIDIDIIAIDDQVIDSPRLQIPHPRMHLRPFVLEPMQEIAAGWIHPVLKQTPGQMLENL